MNMKKLTVLAAVWLLGGGNEAVRAQAIPSDSLALVDLYDSTGGPAWQTSWNLLDPVSSWHGVELFGNRVTALVLSANGLTGVLPASLGDLDALGALDLSFNELSGIVPVLPENIAFLDLSHNSLSGAVPVALHAWYINLSHNAFSGLVPAALSSAATLSELDLSHNDLEGSLPSPHAWHGLGYFNLSHNRFSGSIPASFGNCDQLTVFDVSHNQITGPLPSAFNNLIFLNELRINDNQMDELPSIVGPSLSGAFFAQNNRFDFDDIVPNVFKFVGASEYSYAPQDSIDAAQELEVAEGDAVTVSVSTSGEGNRYQWYFNGDPFAEASTVVFTATQSGVLTCAVNNDLAPELTLFRRPIRLNVVAVQYPGDANRDRVCDAADVFVIAGMYGAVGPARGQTGVVWQAYPAAQDWSDEFDYRGTALNAKFCDADGDGAVTLFDLAAAVLNRGLGY